MAIDINTAKIKKLEARIHELEQKIKAKEEEEILEYSVAENRTGSFIAKNEDKISLLFAIIEQIPNFQKDELDRYDKEIWDAHSGRIEGGFTEFLSDPSDTRWFIDEDY